MSKLPLILLLACSITLSQCLRLGHMQDDPSSAECSTLRIPAQYLAPGMSWSLGDEDSKQTFTVQNVVRSRYYIVATLKINDYNTVTHEFDLEDKVTIDVGARIRYRVLYYERQLQEFRAVSRVANNIRFKLPPGELRNKLKGMTDTDIHNSNVVVEVTCEGLKPVDIEPVTS